MKPGVVHRKKGAPVTLDVIHARCDEVGDCWIWRGAVSHGTAPAINIDGKSTSVRRFVADLLGRQTNGRYITACCGEPLCVSPDHLRVVTRSQLNILTAKRTGYGQSLARAAKIAQARRRRAHLSPELVQMIRSSDLPSAQLAKQLGVSKSTVNDARRGNTWRDYTNPFAWLVR
jgi:hypothetical protein